MIFTFGVFNVILEFIARNFVRLLLRIFRKKGFNQKHILLVGYSDAAIKFIDKIIKIQDGVIMFLVLLMITIRLIVAIEMSR